ncbi:MAG: hypothetical protein Q9194_005861, partial [Teloschistes cf. exilis]
MGQEGQERYRMNRFLYQANKEIFMPHKPYAMIVTYKPGNSDQIVVGTERIDIGAMAVAKYGDKLLEEETEEGNPSEKNRIEELKEKAKQVRIASGESKGEAEMPIMCAPLIFPALDAAVAATMADQKNGEAPAGALAAQIRAKSKSTQKFVQSYMDKRGRATFVVNNPGAKLTSQVEAPKFRSRLADPNNATNMHFFSLITSRKWKAEAWEKKQRQLAAERAQGIRDQSSKRVLSENVLYLMVVNMPTEEELAKAKRELREAKERKAAGRQWVDGSVVTIFY